MFGRKSRPESLLLTGLSDEGFKRLAKDLYDKADLDTIHEMLNGPGMNVYVNRETDEINVWIRGDLAEVLRRTIRIRSIEDEYR